MKARIISLFLALSLALAAPACLAESSNAEDFLNNLGDTWNSFLGMVGDAGKAVTDWADESGVTAWVNGAVNDVTAWANDSSLVDWAQGALDDLSAWAEDIGVTEWAQKISADTQALIEKNRPAVEAWLAQAGEDVQRAWNTLLNADAHTEEEVRQAYDSVVESLEEAGASPNR